MGREVFDTRFLPSKLDQCRVIIMMAKVRILSAVLSGVLAVSAITALLINEYVLAVLLLACMTSLMILRSLIHRAWGGPARLGEYLRTVRRELEYLVRLIDSRIEEQEERISVRKGGRGRVVRSHESTETNLLKSIRYALMLKASKMREFLASGSEEDFISCFSYAIKDLPVFSGVTENPSLKLKMEEVPHDVSMLLLGVETLLPVPQEPKRNRANLSSVSSAAGFEREHRVLAA